MHELGINQTPFLINSFVYLYGKKIFRYSNGKATVVWQSEICQHSTLCWKGLPEAFNPKERPWIKMDGAATERIIGQVKKCPSGALSYFLNTDGKTDKIHHDLTAV